RWLALTRPGLRIGQEVALAGDFHALVEDVGAGAERLLRFDASGADLWAAIHRHGEMPTPPYVRKHLERLEDYQTIYARTEGSVAAPTAGLHFTADLLQRLADAGIETAYLTLHVGP